MGGMDKFEAGTGVGQDSVLEVRVELVDSELRFGVDSSSGAPWL